MSIEKGTRRNHCLRCKVSEEDVARIVQLARESGKTVSSYIRLSALKSSVRPLVITPIARDQWVELSRVASNLNQITRHLNEGRVVDGHAVEDALMKTRYALLAARPPVLKVSEGL